MAKFSAFSERKKAIIVVLATVIVWASAFPFIAVAIRTIPPGAMVCLRFIIASLSFLVIAAIVRFRIPEWRDLPKMAGLSALGISTYHLALAEGQVGVPAGQASLLVATVPIWVALFSRFLFGERVSLWGWAGILLSFVGVLLLVFSRGLALEFTGRAALVLLAAFATSLMYLFQNPISRKYGNLSWVAWSVWLGTLPTLTNLPLLFSSWSEVSWLSLAAVLYLGTVPVFGYISWSYAMQRLDPTGAAAFLNVSPVFAVLLSWWMIGEKPGFFTIVGGTAALAGVWMLMRWGKTQTPQVRKA